MDKELSARYAGVKSIHKALQPLLSAVHHQANTAELFDRDCGDSLLKILDDVKQAVYTEKARRNNVRIAKAILRGDVSLKELGEISSRCPSHMAIMVHQALYEGIYDMEDLQESARHVLQQ
jgi:hypothetical protein